MAWAQKVLDHCTDTDNTALESHTPDLGSGYTADVQSLAIFSNRIYGDGANYSFFRNSTTLGNKQYAQIKIIDRTIIPGVWICAGFSGGNATGYILREFDVVQLELLKFTGSGTSTTSLGTYTAAANNDTIRAEHDGVNTLTAYKNGASQGSVTESTYIGGQSGITAYLGISAADDFEAGDDVASQPPYQPQYLQAPVMAQ